MRVIAALLVSCRGSKSVSNTSDFWHIWSSEQRSGSGSDRLGRYNFLLVFHSDLKSGWNRYGLISQNHDPQQKQERHKGHYKPYSLCNGIDTPITFGTIIMAKTSEYKSSQSILGRAASPSLTAENNYATNSSLVMRRPNLPPNVPLSLRR